MSEDKQLIWRWVKVGVICGILADLCYGLAIGLPMPKHLTNIVFWSFGPLLIAGAPGTYYFIKQHRDSISLQVGTIFMLCAGLSVTFMAVIQRAVFETFIPLRPDQTDTVAYQAWSAGFKSGNAVQLGMDIVWDIFITVATILLAISMYSHPKLGKVISAIGVFVGLAALALNLQTFPTPPGAAGSIDAGPFVGLWFLAVMIMIIMNLKWMKQSLEVST